MRKFSFGKSSKTNSKYGASKALYDGIVFDSIYERDRYIYLKHLEKQGVISQLKRQVRFQLIPKTTKTVAKKLKTKTKFIERVVELPAEYHCDFLYIENGLYICEEFKSKMTAKLPDYILRRKIMVRKICEHNKKGFGQWVFRETVYHNKKKTIITDK